MAACSICLLKKTLYVTEVITIYQKLKNLIIEREAGLDRIIDYCSRKLKNAPSGSLRVARNSSSWQYFLRKSKSDRNGEYLSPGDSEQASKIAGYGEKKYLQKVLKAALIEKKANIGYQKALEDFPENIYFTMSPGLQAVTIPIKESDEMYTRRWLSRNYEQLKINDDSPHFITDRGETVRSKSEQLAANMLNRLGIPYLYEKPLHISGFGTVYPDFTILDVKNRTEVYWEHFGMMDSPSYVHAAVRKLNTYNRNGFFDDNRMIITMETSAVPFDVSTMESSLLKRFAPGKD